MMNNAATDPQILPTSCVHTRACGHPRAESTSVKQPFHPIGVINIGDDETVVREALNQAAPLGCTVGLQVYAS